MFGLDPDSMLARLQPGESVRMRSLGRAACLGALGFALVSVAAFSLWALGGRALARAITPNGLYAAIALVMLAGGAWVFRPLVIGRNLRRFAALFACGFLLFAAAWMVGYMIRAPYRLGEWCGVVVGPILLAVVLCLGFGARRRMFFCAAWLTASHVGGYLAADRLFALEALQNRAGMLIWGLVYGAGFGAGLGATLHACQEEVRSRLASMRRSSDA